MPLYDDHFSGHMETGDPRGPLTAAGACIWPTIPAHRYLLKSTDATGALGVLNATGILMERNTIGIGHDESAWTMIAGPPPVLFALMWKRTLADRLSYEWTIGIMVSVCGILSKVVTRSKRKCNEDFPIGEIECPLYSGNTGSTFTAYQVEFDHTQPPA